MPLSEQFSQILLESHSLHGKDDFEAESCNVVNVHVHLPKYFNKSWEKKN